ncbi:glycine/D-amino acid oxidase-like deaminating enzyme [Shimia isoporae]|uniref:Glycine/D-amino acid oxidase-like deaminating enzyme n=1 Tax=Shimia isoporae TaxID=647720 RepID=A0A4R1NXT6_9RHOB|nr:FAD-binding oxidoreductase [Shimia isoporae]TCL10078.1 glycine/D-amino acid oxidase-like deaminating enzyme [Shimia isoporae]
MSAFPLGLQQPVEHGGALPKEADVAIVGGGIIGVMTAFFLAKKGLRPVVLEKGRVAAEQSSRNWGWIRQQGRDVAELPIMMEANRLWKELAAEVGEDLGLETVGISYLAETERELAEYENWLAQVKSSGVDSRMLSATQAAETLPGATQRFAGALYTPSDLKAEPWIAVPALARAAVRAGAVIVENCAVRGLDLEAGRVAGVTTERGRIKAAEVVVAGGAWSSLFLRRHGVKIPQLSVQALVMATEPAAALDVPATAVTGLAWRRRADGGFTIAPGGWHRLFVGPDAFRALPKFVPQLKEDWAGTFYRPAAPWGYPDAWSTKRQWNMGDESPFERMRVLNPKTHMPPLTKALARFSALFPQLGDLKMKQAWSGMIDTMPDIVPVVDRAESVPGLSICTGMCGHGFGIGPAFGRVMADLVTGKDVGHDLHRFRLSRFSDGSKMKLGPII